MGVDLNIQQKNGISTAYHNFEPVFLPTALSKVRIVARSWVNEASRRQVIDPRTGETTAPVSEVVFHAMQKVKRPVQNPLPGQPAEIEVEEEFNFLDQPIPAGSKTLKDAATKIAYALMKSRPEFSGAKDVL